MVMLEITRHITYNLGNLADWLSAIGTIAAVVVALFLDYFGVLRKSISNLSNDFEKFQNDAIKKQNRQLILYDNLCDCFDYITDVQNNLYFKNNYLKALVPTLEEIKKDLLEKPLVQFETEKTIKKINTCNTLNDTEVISIAKNISNIGKNYSFVLKKNQNKNKRELDILSEKLQNLNKLANYKSKS